MELYLIRHAQSANNATMTLNPDDRVVDPPLTPLGQQQALALAQTLATRPDADYATIHETWRTGATPPPLRFDALYTSPMLRALQTAAPLAAALELSPQVWVATHEHGGMYLRQGEQVVGYTGMTRAEMQHDFPAYTLPEDVTERGWWDPARLQEDYIGCCERALRVALALRERAAAGLKEERHERVGLVSHGGFGDALLKALFNQLPGGSAPRFYVHYNTGITRLVFAPDGSILLGCLNRIDHLPPELVT